MTLRGWKAKSSKGGLGSRWNISAGGVSGQGRLVNTVTSGRVGPCGGTMAGRTRSEERRDGAGQ